VGVDVGGVVDWVEQEAYDAVCAERDKLQAKLSAAVVHDPAPDRPAAVDFGAVERAKGAKASETTVLHLKQDLKAAQECVPAAGTATAAACCRCRGRWHTCRGAVAKFLQVYRGGLRGVVLCTCRRLTAAEAALKEEVGAAVCRIALYPVYGFLTRVPSSCCGVTRLLHDQRVPRFLCWRMWLFLQKDKSASRIKTLRARNTQLAKDYQVHHSSLLSLAGTKCARSVGTSACCGLGLWFSCPFSLLALHAGPTCGSPATSNGFAGAPCFRLLHAALLLLSPQIVPPQSWALDVFLRPCPEHLVVCLTVCECVNV
jgi:hypothetical protein